MIKMEIRQDLYVFNIDVTLIFGSFISHINSYELKFSKLRLSQIGTPNGKSTISTLFAQTIKVQNFFTRFINRSANFSPLIFK